MGSPDGSSQGIFVTRCGNQMNMVGHQAPSLNLKTKFLCLFFEQIKIDQPIIVKKEYVLTVVTPLGDMMRKVRYYNSCYTRHNK